MEAIWDAYKIRIVSAAILVFALGVEATYLVTGKMLTRTFNVIDRRSSPIRYWTGIGYGVVVILLAAAATVGLLGGPHRPL